jgi:hypothetical protein
MWYTGVIDGSGYGEAPRSVLFPLYSCNVSMYLLLALCFIKKGKVFDIIAAAVAYAGTIGALTSVADYLMSPNWQSFEFVKSLVSHILLFFGCIWLFIKYVDIGIKNIIPCLYYTAFCLADGILLMWLLPEANPMWLREPVVDGVNFLSGWNLGWMFLLAVAAFLGVWGLVKYIIRKKCGRNAKAVL